MSADGSCPWVHDISALYGVQLEKELPSHCVCGMKLRYAAHVTYFPQPDLFWATEGSSISVTPTTFPSIEVLTELSELSASCYREKVEGVTQILAEPENRDE